jgi:MFS family permease
MIYACALLLGLINAVDNPARRAFISQLVEPGEISNAMGLNTAVMTSTRIIGPAAAGLLIGTIGAGWCFVTNGFSFAAVIVATLALDRTRLRPAPRVSRASGQVREGLRYAWDDPVLRRTLLAAAVVATLAFNYPTTLPLLTTETFAGDAGTFGALLAVASVGSLLGSLVAASRPSATQRFMAGASVAFGLAMGAVASASGLGWAFVLAIPMGAGGSAFASTTSAVLQDRSRPEMRGRLMALYAVVFLGSTPIGGPIVGWVGEHVSPRASLYLGALSAVVVGLALVVSTHRESPAVPPPVPARRDPPPVPARRDKLPRVEDDTSLPSWEAPRR